MAHLQHFKTFDRDRGDYQDYACDMGGEGTGSQWCCWTPYSCDERSFFVEFWTEKEGYQVIFRPAQ